MKKVMIVSIILSSICFGQQADTNTFISQTAGIQVTKPAQWHFMGLDAVKENKDKIKLQDEKIDAAVKNSNAPIIAIMKYPEPYDGINPSFQILVRPLGKLEGKTETELWTLMLPGLEKAFKDFKLLKSAHEIELSDKKASEIEISYTLETQDGKKYKCQSKMILSLKGSFMYQFGMGFPQKAKKNDLDEIDSIVKSIKFIE